jgi:hypothetical protein
MRSKSSRVAVRQVGTSRAPSCRQRGDARVSPKVRRTFRALAGRRLVIEGFGPRSPVLVAITGGEAPSAAWLSLAELRRLVAVGRKILRR